MPTCALFKPSTFRYIVPEYFHERWIGAQGRAHYLQRESTQLIVKLSRNLGPQIALNVLIKQVSIVADMLLTLKSLSELMADVGNSVIKLFKRLSELRVSVTPKKTSGCSFWMMFRSRLSAVSAFMLTKVPGSMILRVAEFSELARSCPSAARCARRSACLMLFCARSRKAKPLRLAVAFGTVFSWQAFKLRFFSEVSRPRREPSARVKLLSASFNVLSLPAGKD